MTKKFFIQIMLIYILVLSMWGCRKDSSISTEITTESVNKKQDAVEKEKGSDNDIGLKTLVVDSKNKDLTDEQKDLVEYFDNDYYEYNREFFERNSSDFEGCKVKTELVVKKIVNQSSDGCEFLATESMRHNALANPDEIILYVKCPKLETNFMENDEVVVYGIFTGVETKNVDGNSYNVGVLEAYTKSHLSIANTDTGVPCYSYESIKKFANTLFGQNIKIDKNSDQYYVVTFENQSNANFNKVFMDAGLDSQFTNTPIQAVDADENPYDIIVASDFEHFYYFYTNTSTSTTTLAYYDNELNKIWQREFSNVENLAYDYTKKNFYLAVNNDLYIINSVSGEDTFEPIVVGEQSAVRKTADGVYLTKKCSSGENTKVDVLTKFDNEGNKVWTSTLEKDYSICHNFQIVDDKILLEYLDTSSNAFVAIINTDSGSINKTCELVTSSIKSNTDSSFNSLVIKDFLNEYIFVQDVSYNTIYFSSVNDTYYDVIVNDVTIDCIDPNQIQTNTDGTISMVTDGGTVITISADGDSITVGASGMLGEYSGVYDAY